MDIEYMREFIELANNLNYSITSGQLFITQSALTRHIAQLEKELNFQLFYRTTHSVKLTDMGKTVLDEFNKIITIYDNLLNKSSLLISGYQGSLKIGILYYAIDKYVTPMVNYMNANLPNIKLNLFSYQPQQIIPEILSERLDLGLLIKGSYPSSNLLDFFPIAKEKLVLMLSKDNHLSKKTHVTIPELANELFIFVEDHGWLNNHIKNILAKHKISPASISTTDQIDTLHLAINQKNGISIVPEHLKGITREGIEFIDIEGLDFLLDMCIVKNPKNENFAIPIFLKQLESPNFLPQIL